MILMTKFCTVVLLVLSGSGRSKKFVRQSIRISFDYGRRCRLDRFKLKRVDRILNNEEKQGKVARRFCRYEIFLSVMRRDKGLSQRTTDTGRSNCRLPGEPARARVLDQESAGEKKYDCMCFSHEV